MTKAALREIHLKKRADLSEGQIDEKSIAIANKLLGLEIWNYNFYHIFLSIERQKEIDTSFILSILQGKDKNIVISKSDFATGTMRNFLLTDGTLIKVNNYGIPEPEDGIEIPEKSLDIVFIPLLAYDIKGNRVGYGKGFYDRFLDKCREDVIKIGLSFFEASEEPIEDCNQWDIALDYCVTPNKVYQF